MEQESTWLFIYHAGETISIPADQLPGVDVWAIADAFRAYSHGAEGASQFIEVDLPGMVTATINLSAVTAMIVRPNGGDPAIKKVELLGALCEHEGQPQSQEGQGFDPATNTVPQA
jgi:hypothetical protein